MKQTKLTENLSSTCLFDRAKEKAKMADGSRGYRKWGDDVFWSLNSLWIEVWQNILRPNTLSHSSRSLRNVITRFCFSCSVTRPLLTLRFLCRLRGSREHRVHNVFFDNFFLCVLTLNLPRISPRYIFFATLKQSFVRGLSRYSFSTSNKLSQKMKHHAKDGCEPCKYRGGSDKPAIKMCQSRG